jgi:hypothetical protein
LARKLEKVAELSLSSRLGWPVSTMFPSSMTITLHQKDGIKQENHLKLLSLYALFWLK